MMLMLMLKCNATTASYAFECRNGPFFDPLMMSKHAMLCKNSLLYVVMIVMEGRGGCGKDSSLVGRKDDAESSRM